VDLVKNTKRPEAFFKLYSVHMNEARSYRLLKNHPLA